MPPTKSPLGQDEKVISIYNFFSENERENIAAIEPVYKLSKSDKKIRLIAAMNRFKFTIPVELYSPKLLFRRSKIKSFGNRPPGSCLPVILEKHIFRN
jgi:hypothetical protein